MLFPTSKLDPCPSTNRELLGSLALLAPSSAASSISYRILSDFPHWIGHKFAKVQTLGDDEQPDTVNGAHRVVESAYGSTGCVNAMDWEEGGQERLASAGDDTKICIWKPGYVKRGTAPAQADSPFPGYGLSETIETGHRANIFSVRWAPQNENRLFSAAGDCTARVYDISLSTNSSLSSTPMNPNPRVPWASSYLPWSHHSSSACTSIIRCHTDRVKRISTEHSPTTFLTCSEDGTVRQHDLRQTHSCRSPTLSGRFGISGGGGERRHEGCPEPLADYGTMRLYSLSLSDLQPHLFVVAGTSPFAYLHDRRMLRTPMIRDWQVIPSSSNITECVRRFGVPKSPGSKSFIQEQIVAVKMNPHDARDLIVSYSSNGIYRFDIFGEPYEATKVSTEELKSGKRVKRRGEGAGEEGEEDEGELGTEKRIDKKRRSQVGTEGSMLPSMTNAVGASRMEETATETDQQSLPEAGDDDNPDRIECEEEEGRTRGDGTSESDLVSESGFEEDVDDYEDFGTTSDLSSEGGGGESEGGETFDDPVSPFTPTSRVSKHPHQSVPIVAPEAHYSGHANSETVKDVNFAYHGRVVVTGSDDGNFFCYDKKSGECIGIFLGDSSVVNVIQPHPRLPLVAVSGIDQTVKVFGPSSDRNLVDATNLVSNYETIKTRNERGQGSSRRLGVTSGLPDALMRLIAARMGGLGEDGEGTGEGGGGGGGAPTGGGLRVFFDDPSGTGETRSADCTIM